MRLRITALFALLSFLFVSCASMSDRGGGARDAVVRYAKNMLNKRYEYGKQDPRSGFDCSGLAQFAYKEAGINIPRTSKAQYAKSRKIGKGELKPADLVFFSTNGPGASHVGIYIGEGKFIHSPSAGKKVQIVPLNNSYWNKNYFGSGSYIW